VHTLVSAFANIENHVGVWSDMFVNVEHYAE